ncbi:MAG: hypothetical protein TH68_02015 [Candidatus Synechococcus spongiarum 142]|uniref:Uncharacterized protein n=1 Tax=Candidatus Synechococcus spongiarum 142 TaxID=1608213 RepID=A0A6N3XC33_9SYNE|nr:MAG: hypothetical protein TH68_02015 [Candidatus Synechococcus spongiarum 142]
MRTGKLSIGEMLFIMVLFHGSAYKDFRAPRKIPVPPSRKTRLAQQARLTTRFLMAIGYSRETAVRFCEVPFQHFRL